MIEEDFSPMNLPKVYFFCSNEKYNYQHDIVLVAEGLKELGVLYYSNENYWLQSALPDDYLFRHDPEVRPEDCDIVIFPGNWFNWVTLVKAPERKPLPLSLKNRKFKVVYLDSSDGYQTVSWESGFRDFDLILRSHYNRRCYQPENVKPWAFGIPNRIAMEFENVVPFSDRNNTVLCNYGASHGFDHGLRSLATRKFNPLIQSILSVDSRLDDLKKEPVDPYERIMWDQCWGRFNRQYLKRIKESKANLCFCGELIPAIPLDPSVYMVGGKKAMIKKKIFGFLSMASGMKIRNIQWDSWRFWETLAAGSVAIHIDFEKYGVEMPIMPENGKHYIGVDFDQLNRTIENLIQEPYALERISVAGREWATRNYNSKASAIRLLSYLGYNFKN